MTNPYQSPGEARAVIRKSPYARMPIWIGTLCGIGGFLVSANLEPIAFCTIRAWIAPTSSLYDPVHGVIISSLLATFTVGGGVAGFVIAAVVNSRRSR